MNNEFISIMTERIVRDFDPLQIILFGSQARGDADQNSDIDCSSFFRNSPINGKLLLIFCAPWLTYLWQKTFLSQRLKNWNVIARGSDRYCVTPNKKGKILCRKDLNAPARGSAQHLVLPNEKGKYTVQVNDRFHNTSRWLRYADEDLVTAETLLKQPHVPPRQACWHAQQAAEKTLKVVLIFLEIYFSRTHDLDALRNLVPDSWHLKTVHPDLSNLTRWALEACYPEDMSETTNADASKAVEQARTVWTSVFTALKEHGYHVEKDL